MNDFLIHENLLIEFITNLINIILQSRRNVSISPHRELGLLTKDSILNLNKPMLLELFLYVPHTRKYILVERWILNFNLLNDQNISSSSSNIRENYMNINIIGNKSIGTSSTNTSLRSSLNLSLHRNLKTFLKSLICFVKMLPTYYINIESSSNSINSLKYNFASQLSIQRGGSQSFNYEYSIYNFPPINLNGNKFGTINLYNNNVSIQNQHPGNISILNNNLNFSVHFISQQALQMILYKFFFSIHSPTNSVSNNLNPQSNSSYNEETIGPNQFFQSNSNNFNGVPIMPFYHTPPHYNTSPLYNTPPNHSHQNLSSKYISHSPSSLPSSSTTNNSLDNNHQQLQRRNSKISQKSVAIPIQNTQQYPPRRNSTSSEDDSIISSISSNTTCSISFNSQNNFNINSSPFYSSSTTPPNFIRNVILPNPSTSFSSTPPHPYSSSNISNIINNSSTNNLITSPYKANTNSPLIRNSKKKSVMIQIKNRDLEDEKANCNIDDSNYIKNINDELGKIRDKFLNPKSPISLIFSCQCLFINNHPLQTTNENSIFSNKHICIKCGGFIIQKEDNMSVNEFNRFFLKEHVRVTKVNESNISENKSKISVESRNRLLNNIENNLDSFNDELPFAMNSDSNISLGKNQSSSSSSSSSSSFTSSISPSKLGLVNFPFQIQDKSSSYNSPLEELELPFAIGKKENLNFSLEIEILLEDAIKKENVVSNISIEKLHEHIKNYRDFSNDYLEKNLFYQGCNSTSSK